jgi:type I restriction enzyme S subunit
VTGRHDEAIAQGPGVTIGRSGASFGVVSYSSEDFWPLNTALYVIDFHGNDERFAYYLLKQFDFGSFNSGSAQPSLNRNFLHPVPVDIPPVGEQREIARLLGALDDKIKLNRRMSETLEAIARALFRSWFVDFDPVRAEAETRAARLANVLSNAFPSTLGESELGEIPSGWRVSDVYEIAEVVYGTPFKSALFNNQGLGKPLIRIRDLATHQPSVSTPEERPRAYLVQRGDLVVGMDGEFRAHLWLGPEAWLNQRLCCFRPRPGVPRAFVHYSIEQPLAFFERSKTGTTVIHLGKRDIDTFRLVIPTQQAMRAFGELVDPIDARLVLLGRESATLAALRDTLLPKLISGELRVVDAERLAETAL